MSHQIQTNSDPKHTVTIFIAIMTTIQLLLGANRNAFRLMWLHFILLSINSLKWPYLNAINRCHICMPRCGHLITVALVATSVTSHSKWLAMINVQTCFGCTSCREVSQWISIPAAPQPLFTLLHCCRFVLFFVSFIFLEFLRNVRCSVISFLNKAHLISAKTFDRWHKFHLDISFRWGRYQSVRQIQFQNMENKIE